MQDSITALIDIANIAYRLRLARLLLRMTQTEVELALGMSPSALSRLESGAHAFNYRTVCVLIEFYGLKKSDIFQDYTEKPTHTDLRRLEVLDAYVVSCKKSKGYRKIRLCKQLEIEF